jgi:tRNA1Val (adenine37-N6)-methyltransferase
MKVGTDGVLLGAWSEAKKAKRVLDIGCGTGLISLMLAQRSDANFTAIEIDPAAAEQAKENISNSPWAQRIKLIEGDFQTTTLSKKYDLIVCNPPYFKAKQSGSARDLARQNSSLPYPILFQKVAHYLSPAGSFSISAPADQAADLTSLGEENGLYPKRNLAIKGNHQAPVKRMLFEFTFEQGSCEKDSLVIEKSRNHYTEEYANLLADYLVIF